MHDKTINSSDKGIGYYLKEDFQVSYEKEKLKFSTKDKSMKKYKALILDDEIYGRENLALMIETRFEDIEIIGKVASVEEALDVIQKIVPDIFFLDIRLENGIGFDLLDKYPHKNIATVIVSGYDEYGVTALKYGVVDYILKPIHVEDLDGAITKARTFIDSLDKRVETGKNKGVDKLKISTFNGFSLIEIKDIVRLESDSNYTSIFLLDGNKLVVSKTMKEFEPYLDESVFFRVHRSHIINVNCVKGYNSKDGGYVVLKDETMVEISRSKHKEFMEFIAQKFNSIS